MIKFIWLSGKMVHLRIYSAFARDGWGRTLFVIAVVCHRKCITCGVRLIGCAEWLCCVQHIFRWNTWNNQKKRAETILAIVSALFLCSAKSDL
jgi:hypothetical protein